MSSFKGTEPKTETTADAPKLPVVVNESRLKQDPSKWADALVLSNMLSYCRPYNTRVEEAFISKFLVPLGGFFDKYGNFYKQVGLAPTVLWSSHTDTVHSTSGFQKIEYTLDKTGNTIFQVGAAEKSSCLGADDTCGIWLMTEMIKREVPGLYIFHREEEIGGKGSAWVAKENPNAVKGIKFAVAFDRRGEGSIITHQRSRKCCSSEFAKSLAEQLGMGHKEDDTGAFTDTASYVDLIAECTNVSVGYDGAHTKWENTNVDYLLKLRDAVCAMDLSKLVEARKPGDNAYKTYTYTSYSYGRPSGGTADKKYFRGLQGWEGRELREIFGRNYDWWDYYEWDDVTGLWYRLYDAAGVPKGGEGDGPPSIKEAPVQKDLGVTKLSPEARVGKKTKKSTAKASKVLPGPGCTTDNVYRTQADRAAADTTADNPRNSSGGRRGTYNEAVSLIRENPEIIADLLESMGYGPDEIDDHICTCLGWGPRPF